MCALAAVVDRVGHALWTIMNVLYDMARLKPSTYARRTTCPVSRAHPCVLLVHRLLGRQSLYVCNQVVNVFKRGDRSTWPPCLALCEEVPLALFGARIPLPAHSAWPWA